MSLDNAPAFNPEKDYTEVHAHKTFAFKQHGYYYDFHGNPVEQEPEAATVRRGVKKLRQGKQAKVNLDLDGVHVGSLPDAIAETRQENARAHAAEDLLG
jgi:hypothetical protein